MAILGALLSLALPPTGWWPVGIVLAGLFAATANARSGARAFRLGFWFGLPFFAIYISWLPRSFADLLGPSFWAVFPFLTVALAAIWGATTWASWLAAGGGGRRTLLLLPVAWVTVEWARTQGYFAFPWGTLGYLWIDTPVAQLASVVGVYGLSLMVTLAAASFALPLVSPRVGGFEPGAVRLLLAPAGGLLALAVAFTLGVSLLPSSGQETLDPELSALLVQGDVDAFGRLSGARRDLDTHLELTRDAVRDRAAAGLEPFDLVVWPEGAVLGYEVEGADADELLDVIGGSAPGSSMIVGGRRYEEDRSYNSLFSLRDGVPLGSYDKRYLVPFGERWPFLDSLPGLYRTVFSALGLPMLAGTSPGEAPAPLSTGVGEVAAFICYESVFPQVQRVQVGKGAELLVLSTNDAWFARGAGGRQHFDMGRLRAIETRRWLLRAGNDGITAAVDPFGRVTAELERKVAGTLSVSFALRDELTTWVRYGHLTSWLLGAYLLLATVLLQLARPRERATAAERLRRRGR